MFLENLLESGAEGLRFTKSITISMRNDELGVQSKFNDDEDDGLDFDHDEDWVDQEDDLGQKHYQPRVLNTLLRLLISKVPNGCLQTFRGTFDVDFPTLTTLDVRDVDPGHAMFWPALSVANSHKSLTHLKFGCEKYLAGSYLGRQEGLNLSEAFEFTWNLDNDIRDNLPASFQKSSKPDEESSLPKSVLTLESLHLVGIDCHFPPEVGAPMMWDTDKLTSLCLESCFNLGQTFPAPSFPRSPDAPWLLPQLRSFSLRQENSDASFQAGLKAFLLGTKGLVHLAVLLEGSGPFLPPDCVVGNHGSTLQTLVWGQRQGPRKKLDESTDTARPAMMVSPLGKIALECPNLRELGLAVSILTNDTDKEDPHVSQLQASSQKA
ncbi:MAG: hypothetical protein Q9161_005703 [Pseudevernia consocians]